MSKVIMIGCDLHDVSLVLKVAEGPGPSLRKAFLTARRAELIEWIRAYAAQRQATRIVFAYEASGQGFGLYDDLTEAGIECHVLAPTHLPHTAHARKNKTDDKDAEMLLDEVRAHVLAGRKLPSVWVPDPETRDDREVVRHRLELAAQRTRIKNQIRNLFKRWKMSCPDWFSASREWSRQSVQWLCDVAAGTTASLGEGSRARLASLIDLYQALSTQLKTLDQTIERLSRSPRYARGFRKLKLMKGVGTLCAMVFLTEMGDLERFGNRRQLGAYLGLAPAAYESGQRDDRKGHITHQGPARVRHMLCQSAWAALRCSPEWRAKYEQIRRGSAKRTKVAIVAIMRQLGVAMWHMARSAELDEVLEEVDRVKTSARARQKGAAPPALPSPRPSLGEAEATATRKGLA
ncbi:MAG TPA: IS110 family transposase [Pirellulales bacterium]|nr:IS110 family transposase [Pirellulales bacterium]